MPEKEGRYIKGTKIPKPYYPNDKRCVYCQGDYPIDAVIFKAELKNGYIIAPICDVCLCENILEDPNSVKSITNISE